jgi:hypothetical protein
MRASLAFLLLFVISTNGGCEAEEVTDQAGVGAIGVKYWRVRSITKTNGMEWAVTHLSFYDSAADDAQPLAIPEGECTGHEDPKPTSCMIKSSTKEVPKEDPDPSNPDKTSANLLPDTPHPVADAFKDGDDTYWMTNTKIKDEFIGVQFENPTDVKKIKMKVKDLAHSPPRFVVEESTDGDNWARAVEVTNTKDWDEKITTFSWTPMDATPASVFAIRSQKDPTFCIGARPIPDPEEPELIAPKPIDFDTQMEVQRCSDASIPQFWYFDKSNGRLHNAAGEIYIAQVGGGGNGTVPTDASVAPAVGTGMSIGKCTNNCAEDQTNLFAYSESLMGGFLRLSTPGWQNLVIAAPTTAEGGIAEGQVTIGKCGNNGNNAAALSLCEDMTHAQWELMPMFQIENNKKAINCSPYSHSNLEPTSCTDRQTAQALCAKDKQCMAYNWVDSSATGDVKEKVWLCYALHDIHLKTENDDLVGWELGTRSGFAEDLVEYRKTHTIEVAKREWKLEEAKEQALQA